MRSYATSVCGLKLLVYEALKKGERTLEKREKDLSLSFRTPTFFPNVTYLRHGVELEETEGTPTGSTDMARMGPAGAATCDTRNN